MNFPMLLEWIIELDPHFLKASVGFGGSCFQKDILNLVYLCQYYGLNEVAEYWHQVLKINDYQKHRFAQTIIEYFGGDLTGKKILILGWAFKANTNDSRESASIFVTQKLFEAGAIIDIYDPKVSKINIIKDINLIWGYNLNQVSDRLSIKQNNLSFDKYDAYVILTEYEDFKRLEIDPNLVFDGRNIFKQALYSIGKG